MLLIIGAHVFRNGGVNSINKLQQEDIFLKFYHLLIQTQGPISVFLYISGFLVSYLVLKEVMKENWHRSTNILQRMLRILPSFLFVIMLYIAYYPHLASAQLWDGNNPPKDKV
jgi:peptidoglycan/LPS O-acetylase OafA/YrhL